MVFSCCFTSKLINEMMRKKIPVFSILIITMLQAHAQEKVGIGTNTPEGVLHLRSTQWIKAILENDAGQPRGYIGSDQNGTITLSSNAYWSGSNWVYPQAGASMYMLLHRANNRFEFRVRPNGGVENTAMVINTSGNVGIGITNPEQPLSIKGGMVIDQTNLNSGTQAYMLRFGSASGEGIGSKRTAGTNQYGLDFYASNTLRMSIGNNGNIGIGMMPSTGSTRVHISAPAGGDAISLFNGQAYGGTLRVTDSTFQIIAPYGNLFCFPQPCVAEKPRHLVLIPPATGIGVAGNVAVGVNKPNANLHINGTVLIGNQNALPAPGYALSVDGKLVCEELKIELSGGWPDYVFDEKYKLMPLPELEASILKNNHLPGIPSAGDITNQNGFELGTMQQKFLEKIEELTLYMIQANKRINILETELSQLRQEKKK